jgi:hypothetical protein
MEAHAGPTPHVGCAATRCSPRAALMQRVVRLALDAAAARPRHGRPASSVFAQLAQRRFPARALQRGHSATPTTAAPRRAWTPRAARGGGAASRRTTASPVTGRAGGATIAPHGLRRAAGRAAVREATVRGAPAAPPATSSAARATTRSTWRAHRAPRR